MNLIQTEQSVVDCRDAVAALRKKKAYILSSFSSSSSFFQLSSLPHLHLLKASLVSIQFCKVRNIDRRLGHNSQCATENQISHCRCDQLNFTVHFQGLKVQHNPPLQMMMMVMVVVRSYLLLHPPPSLCPPASAAPTVLSHHQHLRLLHPPQPHLSLLQSHTPSCMHVQVNTHRRRARTCMGMHRHTHKRHTYTRRVSKLFVVQSHLKKVHPLRAQLGRVCA